MKCMNGFDVTRTIIISVVIFYVKVVILNALLVYCISLVSLCSKSNVSWVPEIVVQQYESTFEIHQLLKSITIDNTLVAYPRK